MRYLVVNKETGKPVKWIQYKVFSKLLEIRGPKRPSPTVEERWRKGYYRAVKDFKDIYGFEPELRYMEDKKWKKFGKM